MKNNIYTAYLQTPVGWAAIEATDLHITSIKVVDTNENWLTHQPTTNQPTLLQQCIKQLEEYFEGKRTTFSIPIQQEGTDFQQKVWQQLLKIPYGKTITYIELAKQLGDEKLTRAVGAANGKNKLWIIVPCHRVIGANGSLTGYAGGIECKRWLLQHEASFAKYTDKLF